MEMECIAGIDWELLREQKRALLAAADSAEKSGGGDQALHLCGIIELLDSIQDEAAERLGVEEVFGREGADG